MRDFTLEEREKIIKTPITQNCFEYYDLSVNSLNYLSLLEAKRQDLENGWYFPEGIDVCFNRFISMLPSSYNVVKFY